MLLLIDAAVKTVAAPARAAVTTLASRSRSARSRKALLAPANSYRVFLDPKGKVVWETKSPSKAGFGLGPVAYSLTAAFRRLPVETAADQLATLKPAG